MRYRLVMDKRFSASARIIKNIEGALIVFKNGVAESVSEKTAKAAAYISDIKDIVPLQEFIQPATEVTGERISSLYAELGTWAAVAESLGVTVSQLRKLREETGLL